MTAGADKQPGSGSPAPGPADAPRRLVALSRDRCLELLGGKSLGRLVVTGADGLPVVRPVNYLFDLASQSVVFQTAAGSKLHSLLHAGRAVFEVDSIDEVTGTGWSVILVGVAEEISQPGERRRLRDLGVASWAPGDKPHWMRIRAGTVSGREIIASTAAGALEQPPPAP